ncbi:MAG: protein-glutamate O-methyltransferase [Rhodospirillales bacterium]|nr:protein-glutamate O-methyltransferase [Rhodospirillales bacterium]MCW8860819.1 protein-glutamate O-methyltransferase [Rhodospirillales bacterium]MCW8952497.1 protein-glutamate O-methyltransferase [Rhodospirillales bacterium]MCW8970868.1 protein-glutamate O-methyltransferase [Rhodospirillales bacterium]MCW9003541.1 protein-glutamate O-methyltransferase [Rhodospirillales bacterium]
MSPEDFDFVSQLIKKRSGLVLTPEKGYLLESRLLPLARKQGLKSLEELIAILRSRPEEKLLHEVTDAMTTNESFFFRDTRPFDLFRDEVLPKLIESRQAKKRIRIWCAAASTGQEPYSLAMILNEQAAKLAGWQWEIVGTDISTEALTRAQSGMFTQFEVQRGLPIQLLVKYFKKMGDKWEFDPALRAKVKFKEFNLLGEIGALGNYDVIFCRNVLIYFDKETKGAVLAKMAKMLPDDGLLFLGGAETVLGITEQFKPIAGQRGIYAVVK